ncbi:hypothetical protein KY313_01450 [Candidatus Woesearchaeota archaeon]|jgi:hypothetical protein|nr:hypothetical protein [Candidatus Woesearchaeota archaeon]
MNKITRPKVVWVYLLLVAAIILNEIVNTWRDFGKEEIALGVFLFTIILIVPSIIFLYLFFMLKKNSLIWLYISFGLNFVLNLISQAWISAGLTLVIGWVVWDYIYHKKVEGKPLFR